MILVLIQSQFFKSGKTFLNVSVTTQHVYFHYILYNSNFFSYCNTSKITMNLLWLIYLDNAVLFFLKHHYELNGAAHNH